MVYSADVIPGAGGLAAQNRLATLLSYKLKRKYSEICGFLQEKMSLAIVKSNILLLCVPCNKGAHIRQQTELTYGAVMALLAPWRGLNLRKTSGGDGVGQGQGFRHGEGR